MKIPECMVTLPEQLRANGYQTFATGKWHSDHASFNRSFAAGENIFFGGMHPYEKNGHCSPRLHHYDRTGQYKETSFIGEEFSSKMFADAAIEFLSTAAKAQNPFMAFVSFTSPHDPRNQLPDYGKKYKAKDIILPTNFLPQHRSTMANWLSATNKFFPHPAQANNFRRNSPSITEWSAK